MSDQDKVLIINPLKNINAVKALASEPRVQILNLLKKDPLNVNDIASLLNLPQSTAATHITILEKANLLSTKTIKAKKGNQKICYPSFSEIIIQFPDVPKEQDNYLDVEMPIGIFNNFEVTSPCGLCSSESIIGYLDIPDSFLNPDRVKAGLIWCGSGFFEYKFPNNSISKAKEVQKIEFIMELSSEVPGTDKNWPSDITMWVNNLEIGTWTSPGDFGDKRGSLTPQWWKLKGSQYGLLKHWVISKEGSFIDGVKISNISLDDLHVQDHHSIKMKIGVKENAEHLGGMNIFGKNFGNYDQGIILRMYF